MKIASQPEIVTVENLGTALVVQFKGDPEVTVFPADMLYSAKNLANTMHQQNLTVTTQDN